MLALARLRGMRAIQTDDLGKLESGTFDGAIASYVFHLAESHGDLALLARAIKTGGRLAANFHKRMGLPVVSEALISLGFRMVNGLVDSGVAGDVYRTWERE